VTRCRGVLLVLLGLIPTSVFGQDGRPTLEVGAFPEEFHLDGRLDEPIWLTAPAISSLTMTEPVEGGDLVGTTVVRVLADSRTIVIGIACSDPDPSRIVSYSKARDSQLRGEDHIKFILDTFLESAGGLVPDRRHRDLASMSSIHHSLFDILHSIFDHQQHRPVI